MMGNEKEGLSHEALNHCDALIKIPQVGMAESLNVSTATAIILYEAFRQRFKVGKYDVNPDLSLKESTRLLEYLYSKDDDRTHNSKKYRLDSLDGIES
jgi:tRNA (guanosine-2'-O-)-methyltransferase